MTSKEETTKIGLELELGVTDQEGRAVNRADEIINHPLNRGDFVEELTHGVVEFNSISAYSLQELESSVRGQLIRLQDIADSLGLRTVPLSKVGREGKLQRRDDVVRYDFLDSVFGQDNCNSYGGLCGTHVHVDREEDTASQYNLLQSLDPTFALLSSSSFLEGQNTLNCRRTEIIRNQIFKDMPLHGQLQDYVGSLEELEQQNDQRLSIWMEKANSEEAKSAFDRYNTSWGPIRHRDRTIEIRNGDANLLSLLLAQAAFYKGVNDYVFDNNLQVSIGEGHGGYALTDSEIVLPNYQTLQRMQQEGSRHGLRSDRVHSYLSYLMDIARDGLSPEEKKYLAPFEIMLTTRKNVADIIHEHAEQQGYIQGTNLNAGTAPAIYRYVHDAYRKDLANPSFAAHFLDS